MTRPLSLSDHQLDQVRRAASKLLPSHRVKFLEGLAQRLGETSTDAAVAHAIGIQLQLALRRVPRLLNDAAPNTNHS
jgi:hypothetical protein